jgi:hypothetical protein
MHRADSWGEPCWVAGSSGASIQLQPLLLVLSAFNLWCALIETTRLDQRLTGHPRSFSIYGATVVFKSGSKKNYDGLLACVFATGCINMLAAYMRQSIEDSWFGWMFTMTLMLDSLLNLSTAYAIMMAERTPESEGCEPTLPQYMPVPSLQPEEKGSREVEVWVDEKSCACGGGDMPYTSLY